MSRPATIPSPSLICSTKTQVLPNLLPPVDSPANNHSIADFNSVVIPIPNIQHEPTSTTPPLLPTHIKSVVAEDIHNPAVTAPLVLSDHTEHPLQALVTDAVLHSVSTSSMGSVDVDGENEPAPIVSAGSAIMAGDGEDFLSARASPSEGSSEPSSSSTVATTAYSKHRSNSDHDGDRDRNPTQGFQLVSAPGFQLVCEQISMAGQAGVVNVKPTASMKVKKDSTDNYITSADLNHRVLNSAANSSGASMGASSLVTDANSSLSGGPQLQKSSSINNESYTHLPASPLSFSSNNISCSSVMDGSSIVQQIPQQEHMVKQGNSSNISQSIMHESGMMPAEKRPRMDMRQQSPQIQAIIHQQRLAQAAQQQQQQQILQSQLQRIQVHQQTQQPRPNPVQLVSPARRPTYSGLCAWRLMQYMYHQSHRPPDNSTTYWRKFVVEYFAPKAKKRWCLSLYNGVGSHPLGTFPQASMDAWQCGICGSKSGKGFEATYEVLPRLNQIKFDHEVIDELLYLEMPREGRLPSGMMVLEYEKAVQESVYEQIRVVREGQLRIIFIPDLKILCWEFCARRHEELFPRRMMAHQVNQLLHVAQKYQAAVNESGTSGLSVQDMQASCNMFVAVGWQLARNLELQSLNDLGFSKRYVRCLQISEVVNSMGSTPFAKMFTGGMVEEMCKSKISMHFDYCTTASTDFVQLDELDLNEGSNLCEIMGSKSNEVDDSNGVENNHHLDWWKPLHVVISKSAFKVFDPGICCHPTSLLIIEPRTESSLFTQWENDVGTF
ncbi:probable transcriptional regulator SLK2 [Dendrobium catenatum]|uniref:Transcriptional corepressor SEUSS n=1 Tax=Dendrobium catenatum TaxID=906689 RepID=A0A2I0X7Z2_9ASPA|nr:probable transcriptional regulator SLK2 [Dendrobium catenatum]PKU84035.1 Transcriptional corepressor SEUSS [Dendrobium catenatum]